MLIADYIAISVLIVWQRGLARSDFCEASTLFSPILLDLTFDGRGVRIFDLEPMRRTPGAIRRAEALSAAPHLEAARLILEIDISKLLAIAVAHDEAGGLFFDGSRRWEAALRHWQRS
jgi:hypothetical protein